MIAYFSTATSYKIFDEKYAKGEITGVNPAQRFNYNLIKGLSFQTRVTAISALPVIDRDTERIFLEENGTDYICIANKGGRLRKIVNIARYKREAKRALKREKAEWIVCDAVGLAASWTALYAARKFKIPCAAIVTDIPGLTAGKVGFFEKIARRLIKKYDAYIVLTEAMNELVNPCGKPYLVMEGSCYPSQTPAVAEKGKKIFLYSGALWRGAGLDEMMQGFAAAGIAGAQLHIYGDGEYRPEVERFCAAHDCVQYKGCVPNETATARQREAALLVNPRPSSLPFAKYSFPSKTMEYMLSGTPVLMTRLPGLPKEYEKYLYFVEEETAEGFKKAFEEIAGKDEGELLELGEAAKQFVTKNKSYKAQAEKIYNFLCAVSGSGK